MLAAMKGNESIVRLLEEAGADMTLVDNVSDGGYKLDLNTMEYK